MEEETDVEEGDGRWNGCRKAGHYQPRASVFASQVFVFVWAGRQNNTPREQFRRT